MMLHRAPAFLCCSALWLLGVPTPAATAERPPPLDGSAPRTAQRAVDTAPWPRHTIDASSVGADGVKLADVNRDGLRDIITGWEEGGEVRLYLNPGPAQNRQPWPRLRLGQVRSPEDAVLADLDGDGMLD